MWISESERQLAQLNNARAQDLDKRYPSLNKNNPLHQRIINGGSIEDPTTSAKHNILSAKQISEGLSRNKLTDEELERINSLDLSDITENDWQLIEKYNAYVMYKNAGDRARYEAEVEAAKQSGPISSYQPTEEYTEEDYVPVDKLVYPSLEADNGELHDLFGGSVSPHDIKDSNFLFTDDGVIPLSEEGSRLLRNYTIQEGRPANFMFGLEGDSTETIAGQMVPKFTKFGKEEPELPRGVVRGIPEGEDPSNYISIGIMDSEPMQNADGSLSYGQLKGDPYLYIKVLDRPREEIVRERPAGDPVPIYPTMPEEPEYLDIISVDGFHSEPEVDPPPTEDQNLRAIQTYPHKDPILKEETEDNVIVQDEEVKKPKDPLFGANLMANIAKGLEGWNLQGVNIPVPSYDQQRYQSGELGLAVQNLYRGR